jgi:hypothetical protein
MQVKSRIEDLKINAINLLVEISMAEYVEIAKTILTNNAFQRRRVKSSATVYSLLKEDLKQGCIIPPIVLALSQNLDNTTISKLSDEELIKVINQNHKNLLILDGLQRTYTLIELRDQIVQEKDEDLINMLDTRQLRVEIYLGINKIGILYRMLTLNTGQTPMSLRHQVEILYSDYLSTPPPNILLLTESDNRTPQNFGEYKFKDVIEGFDSYLERDELPIDRGDLLDNIKSLEKLSKENNQLDLFSTFLEAYNSFIIKVDEISPAWIFEKNEISYSMSGSAFGKNVVGIFSKSQALTGFGSAIGKLIDFGISTSFQDILNEIPNITLGDDDGLDQLIINLDRIKVNSKKIGNDQRLFFHFFFRELFNKDGDSYLSIKDSVREAYKSFERKTM